MNEAQIIELAIDGFNAAAKLVETLKEQQGLSDEQLLEIAASKDAETRDRIAKFLSGQKPA